MIYIEQNIANDFITRFWDRRQAPLSYFLWKVKNEFSGLETKFLMYDTTYYPEYYNRFTLTHTSNPSNVNGVDTPIYLQNGHNYYTVYETSHASLDEIYLLNPSKPIETGIMFVEIIRSVNTATTENVYY